MGVQDSPPVAVDAVVAADGSGNYTTIAAVVAAVPLKSTKRYVIHIKKGIYNEAVTIGKGVRNLTLLGDGMGATIISAHQSVGGGGGGLTTFKTATLSNGFMARELTIENTAGPENHQAVALRSTSDSSVVYLCEMRWYQDTLYAKSGRQLYRECRISGTVDFIFGDAAAVFQRCTVLARLPLPGQQNTITAQSRGSAAETTTGFSFQHCDVRADDDLLRATGVETYLGRPWGPFSRVVFMECTMSSVIHPKGWLPWSGGGGDLSNVYYGEYRNEGEGGNVSGRVKWPGFHVIEDASEAAKFTVDSFIQGNLWIPKGVEHDPGL
uniref:Pectinesterase n=1 Tax=Oryza brachyantha TaxID=4533 RepID=J3MZR7_ORYBR